MPENNDLFMQKSIQQWGAKMGRNHRSNRISAVFMRNFTKENAFLLILFCSLAMHILLKSYLLGVFISPDSAGYLSAAQSILDGNGFYTSAKAGNYEIYFTSWPIGYPFLIAITSWITQTNVYLASKLLSIIIVFIILIVFRRRFRNLSVIYSLLLLNASFISIFLYTWSEQPFILGLVWFACSTYDVMKQTAPRTVSYFSLLGASLWLFLCRYIGAFSVGIIGLLILQELIRIARQRMITKENKSKLIRLFVVAILATLVIALYLFINYRNTGSISGERIPAPESVFQLLFSLIMSVVDEARNVIPNITFSRESSIVLVISIVLFGFYQLRNIRKIIAQIKENMKYEQVQSGIVFAVIGITYGIAISMMRFLSHFDGFGFRLLLPSTLLIMIGIISMIGTKFKTQIEEFLGRLHVRTYIFAALFLGVALNIIPLLSYSKGVLMDDKPLVAYHEREQSVLAKYQEIPSGSTIIFPEYEIRFLRQDLIPQSVGFGPYSRPETKSEFLSRIEPYMQRDIYFDVQKTKDYLEYYEFDESIILFLSTLKESNKDILSLEYLGGFD